MRSVVEELGKYDRLSGTQTAEAAVDALCRRLDAQGIAYARHAVRMWVSDPVYAGISVLTPIQVEVRAKTRSFSASCPDGVVGDLAVDATLQPATAGTPSEPPAWRGKVVLSATGTEEFVKVLEEAGALGLIHVWPGKEDALHEETVGPVWGNPGLAERLRYPKIPVASVNRRTGRDLVDLAAGSRVVVSLKTRTDCRVATASLVVADIPGITPEYVLLSGHYDSWHLGATDNAVGNALCLEAARIFGSRCSTLRRGLRVAWWPGHSNGRYAGSTWYCDHNFDDLARNCVAHVNVDSPGSAGGVRLIARTAGTEDRAWLGGCIARHVDPAQVAFAPPPRGADHSFFGTGIPLHMYLKAAPDMALGAPTSAGSAGGWWWHTEDDTLDKVDWCLLERDTRLHVDILQDLLTRPELPLDVPGAVSLMRSELAALDVWPDATWRDTVLEALEELAQACEGFIAGEAARPEAEQARMLRRVAGRLNWLAYSATSPYDHDPSYVTYPFPGLRPGATAEASEQVALALETSLRRQTNRVVHELRTLAEEVTAVRGAADRGQP